MVMHAIITQITENETVDDIYLVARSSLFSWIKLSTSRLTPAEQQ